MKATRSKKRPEVTFELDRVMFFEDRPGGMKEHSVRNGAKTYPRSKQTVTMQMRFATLARLIDNCVTSARWFDPAGLEDVIALLQKARQKVVARQNK